MTVKCDKMTVNVLPERFERTVNALPWAAEEALRARRNVQMVTLLYCLFTQRCSRSWLFCSNMTYKQAFLQFLARHSVFAAFEYPYKHHIDRPTCAACSDLTAQTFLTLHLFGRNFTDFCINILSLENRPANGGFRVNESGWFCTTLDSTLFRVNNSRWTRSSHPFCAYLP